MIGLCYHGGDEKDKGGHDKARRRTVNDGEAIGYFLARGAYNVTTRSLVRALTLRA